MKSHNENMQYIINMCENNKLSNTTFDGLFENYGDINKKCERCNETILSKILDVNFDTKTKINMTKYLLEKGIDDKNAYLLMIDKFKMSSNGENRTILKLLCEKYNIIFRERVNRAFGGKIPEYWEAKLLLYENDVDNLAQFNIKMMAKIGELEKRIEESEKKLEKLFVIHI